LLVRLHSADQDNCRTDCRREQQANAAQERHRQPHLGGHAHQREEQGKSALLETKAADREREKKGQSRQG
jgi:hypothetical protein